LAIDASGNIFVADTNNQRIRELIPQAQSSTAFSVADGGGTSLQTGGSPLASTTVGYAHVNTDTGSSTPAGFAIIGFRENNVLVSEAGVPGSGLLTTGRIYAEIGNNINTGVAIANPNNQIATVSFYFTDQNGSVAQGSTTIPANGQLAKFLDQPPFFGHATSGTFTFNSSIPIAVVALRGRTNERSEFILTTLPVTDLTAPATTAPVVFPHFATGGGWTTQVVLVNPTDTALSGTLVFLDPQGQNAAVAGAGTNTLGYTIPPRSSFKYQTSGTSTTPLTGSVHVLPSPSTASPSGVAIFSFQSRGVTVSEAGVPAQPAGTAFRVYVESAGDFDHNAPGAMRTGLAIANTSTSASVVIVELDNLDGSTGLIGTLPLPANGQVSLFVNQIPGFGSLVTPFRGILRLTTFVPITIVGLRGRYNERNDLLITTTPPANEAVPAPASGLFFPHFADAGGYTTQFVLFGGKTGDTPSGTIQFVSQAGGEMKLILRQ
jgi:hypothetical protein